MLFLGQKVGLLLLRFEGALKAYKINKLAIYHEIYQVLLANISIIMPFNPISKNLNNEMGSIREWEEFIDIFADYILAFFNFILLLEQFHFQC